MKLVVLTACTVLLDGLIEYLRALSPVNQLPPTELELLNKIVQRVGVVDAEITRIGSPLRGPMF
jgi:hypothetical protein